MPFQTSPWKSSTRIPLFLQHHATLSVFENVKSKSFMYGCTWRVKAQMLKQHITPMCISDAYTQSSFLN